MKWSDAGFPVVPGTIHGETGRELTEKRIHTNLSGRICAAEVDYGKALSLLGMTAKNSRQTSRHDRQTSFEERRAVVRGYRELLHGLNGSHFLTFMPSRFVRPETLAENIKKFCCRLERKALGRNWHKTANDRLRLIGFLESPDITPHYHALADMPAITAAAMREGADEIWRSLMPLGKLDTPGIKDKAKVISYITKDLHHISSAEHVVIYAPIPKT